MESHCIVLSAAILSSLDITQDPCENFYEYVSKYLERLPVEPVSY